MDKIKVLFLGANPSETTRLRVDVEVRDVKQKLRAAEYRDSLEVISEWAVRPGDLLQYLNQHRPHIVHFAGHGSAKEELILEDNQGKPKRVSKKALVALFKALKDNIRVVVLNACYSRPQAEAITTQIDCAIGMKEAIGDNAAITFAASFYRAIGFGRSIQEAFDQGITALLLEDIPEEDTPVLHIRDGVDARSIRLTGPASKLDQHAGGPAPVPVHTPATPNSPQASELEIHEADRSLLTWYFEQCAQHDDFFEPHANQHEEDKIRAYMVSSGLAVFDQSRRLLLTDPGVLLCCKRQSIPRHRLHVDVSFQQKSESEDLFENPSGSILYLYQELLDRLRQFFHRRMGSPTIRSKEGTETVFWDYPKEAIIEALVNMLIHRDYMVNDIARIIIHPDRMQFINPGQSLYDPDELLARDTPLHPHQRRNPKLIDALNAARLNQREGGGILKIRRELERNGSFRADGSLGLTAENDAERDRFILTIYRRRPPTELAPDRLATVGSALTLAAPTVIATPSPGLERVSLAKMPTTSPDLFGREKELQILDEAWDDPNTNVVSLVAFGGVGKTALVNKWLLNMREQSYRGARHVFGWSFYSQGASEGKQASADLFIDNALRWFGDPDATTGSPWEKGERLGELVNQHPTLLVLDGLEPLQYPPGSAARVGGLKDPALQTLLRELARHNAGLCVLTTRIKVEDIHPFVGTSVCRVDLDQLSPEAGAQLLKGLGAEGTAKDLSDAVEDFGGHALALTLLGKYVATVHGGDIRKRDLIAELMHEPTAGGHARRVMESYETWFKGKPELQILRIMGLFDRLADGGAIKVLKDGDPIDGLTSDLVKLSHENWQFALRNLREARLLAEEDPDDPETLNCHPFIREHFADRLQADDPKAWKEAHARLYEYFRNLPEKELPDTLEEMTPLFQAVTHGCHAGRYDEAFNEVYWRRIRRRTSDFVTKSLGAYGADLAVLTALFDEPWVCTAQDLDRQTSAVAIALAGMDLRALGRVKEAIQTLTHGLTLDLEANDWHNAAVSADNLAGLFLSVGEIPQALAHANEGVELTDRSGQILWRTVTRAGRAAVLHASARIADAQKAFQAAERMHIKADPEHPSIYGVQGYHYCDLLLGMGDYEEVLKRAAQTLEWVTEARWLLDIALDHLSIGKAHLDKARDGQDHDLSASAEHLNEAVDGLRRAGQQQYILLGLLARAELYRVQRDLPSARRDVDEAMLIASRGEMRLHECDCHLEYTRLALAEEDKDAAREHLDIAAKMVEEMGYHRRDPEVLLATAELQLLEGNRDDAQKTLDAAKNRINEMGSHRYDIDARALDQKLETRD